MEDMATEGLDPHSFSLLAEARLVLVEAVVVEASADLEEEALAAADLVEAGKTLYQSISLFRKLE